MSDLIIKYSHIANYNMTKTEIAEVDMQWRQAQMKVANAVTKNQRVLSRARVLTAAKGLEARRKLDDAAAAKVRKQWHLGLDSDAKPNQHPLQSWAHRWPVLLSRRPAKCCVLSFLLP